MPAQISSAAAAALWNWQKLATGLIPLALLAWLGLSQHWLQPVRDAIDISRWVNGDVTLRQIAARLAWGWAVEFAACVAIGAFTVIAFREQLARLKPLQQVGAVLFTSVLMAFLVRSAQLGRWPEVGHLLSPLLALLLGAISGNALTRGQPALVRLATQFSVAVLIAGVLALVAARLAISSAPLPFEPAPASEFSLRALADKLRGVRGSPEEGRHVRLLESDINSLIAVAASRLAPSAKGQVAINGGAIVTEVSLPLPGGAPRFANLRAQGAASINGGQLALRCERLSLGSLAVPRVLLWLLSGPIASTLNHDPDLRSMLGSIASLRLEGGAAEVVFWPGECSDTFIPALALAVTGRTSVADQTRAQVRHLVENAGTLPAGDDRFLELLRRAFTLAQERSASGDPVEENRAAILALAILLGDPRVATVVGPVFDEPLREQAERELANTTLRGRADWTKHFALSAGMVAKACEGVSDRVGVLKELRDSQGGSGFSFGDMAANRAGIRLAQVATFNAAAARTMQARLVGPLTIDDVFPDVVDLPEDLSAAEFQSRFGGIHGLEYHDMLAEIDRRLATCSVLHP